MISPAASDKKTRIRMAVYTRKSTDENLDDEMNSLEVQRETAEAYIASQRGEGWVCLPQRYDDGGYSGGNTDRPAFRRLMEDIEKGRVDGVVVYKLDRLSRSILDFAKMMEVFDARGIALVSVTQSFNTSTSLGRLIVHILLSFAQFEREQITERIRDKMSACRKRGKWVGGTVPYGYVVAPGGGRLMVDPDDAERVRTIFELYIERQSLLRVAEELRRRDWTRVGRVHRNRRAERDPDATPTEAPPAPRRAFDRAAIHRIITNPTYIGKVLYKDALYDGEHEAIIPEALWEKTQAVLRENGRTRRREPVNKSGALLRGLVECKVCGRAMTHIWSTKRHGTKRYRYYVCGGATMNGWRSCPSKSLPAGEIERHVLEQLDRLGRDPAHTDQVARLAFEEWTAEMKRFGREADDAQTDARRAERDLARAAERMDPADLAEAHERQQRAVARLAAARESLAIMEAHRITPERLTPLFARFQDVWATLTIHEQERMLKLLIAKVTYDGAEGVVAITYRPGALSTLDTLATDATVDAAPSP